MKKETGKILLHAALLILFTVPFWVFNLDMKLESALYDQNLHRFTFADNPFFDMLYKYGTIPAVCLALGAIVIFFLGFIYKRFKDSRRAAALIILTMLLGPGLIINVILKNYAGRPRPREVVELGGKWDFKRPLVPGTPGKGFSFPCGHCSMGFVFYALYLINRKTNKGAAAGWLAGSAVFGGALGLARMAQGAHFASDVLWAGGITVLTAEILYYRVLNAGNNMLERIKIRNKPLVFSAAGIVVTAMAISFMMATPFYRVRADGFSPGSAYSIKMSVDAGDVSIKDAAGSAGRIEFEASGFGLPWADYEDAINRFETGHDYTVRSKGYFTELNASIITFVPAANTYTYDIINKNGGINYTASAGSAGLKASAPRGEIVFSPSAGTVSGDILLEAGGNITINMGKAVKPSGLKSIDASSPSGIITFINGSVLFPELKNEAARMEGSKEINLKPFRKDQPSLNLKASRIELKN